VYYLVFQYKDSSPSIGYSAVMAVSFCFVCFAGYILLWTIHTETTIYNITCSRCYKLHSLSFRHGHRESVSNPYRALVSWFRQGYVFE